jgi:hypothetical protein
VVPPCDMRSALRDAGTMRPMPATVQKLKVGQLVEVDDRLYDVVSDKEGGVALEPAITTTMDRAYRQTGGRPATAAEIEALLGDVPTDGEG